MKELGLLETDAENRIFLPPQESKVELTDAPVLKQILADR